VRKLLRLLRNTLFRHRRRPHGVVLDVEPACWQAVDLGWRHGPEPEASDHGVGPVVRVDASVPSGLSDEGVEAWRAFMSA